MLGSGQVATALLKRSFYYLSSLAPVDGPPFNVRSFNEHGDIAVERTPRTDIIHLSTKSGFAAGYRPRPEIVEHFRQATAECQQRGAILLVIFPALPDILDEASRDNLRDFIADLQVDPSLNVLGGLTILDVALFFDSRYHLTREGARRNSERVVEAIQNVSPMIDPASLRLALHARSAPARQLR
jgi:hypothetical protein